MTAAWIGTGAGLFVQPSVADGKRLVLAAAMMLTFRVWVSDLRGDVGRFDRFMQATLDAIARALARKDRDPDSPKDRDQDSPSRRDAG